jgi:hypothetical protein
MQVIGTGTQGTADIHYRYVADRYRDGALSDAWTDVTRCAEQTFIAYVARCGCGWLGMTTRPTPTDTTPASES